MQQNVKLSPAAIALLLVHCVGPISVAAGSASDRDAINVLLITSEDNGPELGCYGDKFVRTPNLDRLAAEGVRFDRAFVTTASCSESRGSILTGLYPHQNGQIGLATHHYRMFPGVQNLPSLLSARGYRTGLIGKLHINPESDFAFDYRPNVREYNTFAHRDVSKVAVAAAKFFSESDQPFFLMVNYADVHLPFLRQQVGLPERPLSGSDVRLLPWVGLDSPRLRAAQADYYNCMERMDRGVGMLLAALDRAGLKSRTLVIYLGDHGAQFPRGKLAIYESSLRIPLIVRWPQQISAGQTKAELISTVDLVPTILEAVGAPPREGLPGRSLLPLVQQTTTSWREYLHSEYHGHYPPLYFPQRAVRDERYKLIANLLHDRRNPVAALCTSAAQVSYATPDDVAKASEAVRRAYATWSDPPLIELYDLNDDPHEWRNRAEDPALAEVKARLLAELKRWQQQTADPLADPAKLAQLTAEHDALEKPYQRRKGFIWKYPEYLAPGSK